MSSRPLAPDYAAAAGNWRHQLLDHEAVWAKAVHRIVAGNISPEQAVDEAIARIKQILSDCLGHTTASTRAAETSSARG